MQDSKGHDNDNDHDNGNDDNKDNTEYTEKDKNENEDKDTESLKPTNQTQNNINAYFHHLFVTTHGGGHSQHRRRRPSPMHQIPPYILHPISYPIHPHHPSGHHHLPHDSSATTMMTITTGEEGASKNHPHPIC